MDEILKSNPIEALPLPKVDVSIRPAVAGDLGFIDSLQKMHTNMVGWMPMQQLEQKIAGGNVLVARASSPCSENEARDTGWKPVLLGYIIGHDQYFKHDDVGIIYQLNVLPMHQRGLIGATLLKAQFERSAYGCKLYCCWCAQDLAANHFWESMGFVALAYRAGSLTRGQKSEVSGHKENARVHIFWQKRIRAGDTTTPWWFPSRTAGGAIREDRIVLPIPPGTHWSDAKPLILPGNTGILPVLEQKEHGQDARGTKNKPREKKAKVAATPLATSRNGLIYEIPRPGAPLPKVPEAKPKAPRAKRVCDPRLVSAARELRDRWLEHVNASPIVANGKYDVTRSIADQTANARDAMKLLAA
jgi:hypothetical protein